MNRVREDYKGYYANFCGIIHRGSGNPTNFNPPTTNNNKTQFKLKKQIQKRSSNKGQPKKRRSNKGRSITTTPRKGRPPSPTTQKANEILNKYPKTSPKELRRILARQNITVTANHARQLKHQFSNANNQFSNGNNKIRHFNNSQLYNNDIYDIILDYIYHKEAQNKRFVKCLRFVFGKRYINPLGATFRYEYDLMLETKDHMGRERRCITQLKNKETFIERNHKHRHNNKTQIIAYHVGDHNLCKFLCNYLGLEYKSRIYMGKGHYISTDASGLDICHLECFKDLLNRSIETQREGTDLLQSTFLHGKLVVGNKVKFDW